jgi:hypothetical protein
MRLSSGVSFDAVLFQFELLRTSAGVSTRTFIASRMARALYDGKRKATNGFLLR